MGNRIDPNRYVDGVPITPRQIIERIASLDDASEGFARKRDALKKEAKELGERVTENDDARRDLLRCHRMGRCVYQLTDGTITTEPPRGLELWDAAERAKKAERSQADAASYVAPVFELYGAGKAKGNGYRRKLEVAAEGTESATVKVGLLVQTTKPGEWIAARAKKGETWEVLEGGPWRTAADAILSALAAVAWKGDAKGEVEGWEPCDVVAGLAPVEKPAEPAKASKPKGQADDGAIYRASFGEGRSLAVAQVTAPGPWSAYVDQKRVGGDFESSDAAKAAVAEHLKAKDLAWLGSKAKLDPPRPAGSVPVSGGGGRVSAKADDGLPKEELVRVGPERVEIDRPAPPARRTRRAAAE